MRIAIPGQRSQFIKRKTVVDPDNPDRFEVQDTEELDRLLAYCRQREEDLRFSPRDGLFHVAEVPVNIYEQAVREGWDHPDGWREWLNRPENACFRTWKGQV